MKIAGIALAVVVLIATVIMCAKIEKPPPPPPPIADTHRLIVILLDNTGSVLYWVASIERIKEIASGLNPDDFLYIILINNKVTEPDNLMVLPNVKIIHSLKLNYAPGMMFCQEAQQYRQDYCEQISRLKFSGCNGTDIYGAFHYASSTLAGETKRDKYLLVFSDLGDTKNRKELVGKISLADTKVSCLYFPTDLIDAEHLQYKPDPDFWKDQILSWGAASVDIYNHIQSEEVDPLK